MATDGMLVAVQAITKVIDNTAPYGLNVPTGYTPPLYPGEVTLYVRTSAAGVYIGGADMPAGSDFPAGGIDGGDSFTGYELTEDQEYQFTMFGIPGEGYGIYFSTTSETPVIISTLLIPRKGPGA
jgi:hypothetical protein